MLENVPRILPEGLCAEIDCASWDLPPVFKWLVGAGNLKPNDMATTLNAGIGMVVICSEASKDVLKGSFEGSGESVYEIGRITKGDDPVKLSNQDTAWA